MQVAFVYWSVFDLKIKIETNAMNMRSQIMICIKLKLVPKRFMRMPQTQNSQAGWIKFKCNDSSWEQPLHILGMMKWMIDGAESGKIFKTLLICCVLGKYDASYSCLFCCSYETFETDFPTIQIGFPKPFRFHIVQSNQRSNSTGETFMRWSCYLRHGYLHNSFGSHI